MIIKLFSWIFRTALLVPLLVLGANVASAQTVYATTTPNTGAGATAVFNMILIAGCIAILVYGSRHLRKVVHQHA